MVLQRLVAQPPQQLRTADTFEAGIVMTLRDQRRPALTFVDNPDRAPVARKIDGRGKASGSAPDDQAIEGVGFRGWHLAKFVGYFRFDQRDCNGWTGTMFRNRIRAKAKRVQRRSPAAWLYRSV